MLAAAAGTPVQASVGLGGSAVNITPDGTYNGSNQTSKNSVVVGYQNNAAGGPADESGKIIYGAANTANRESSLALGNQNKAINKSASAIGVGNTASGEASVAMGNVSTASGDRSVAIGSGANATQGAAIAIGRQAEATGSSAVALGYLNKATNNVAVGVGVNNKVSGQGATSIGSSNTVTGDKSSGLGRQNTVDGASVAGAVAVGYQNKASGDRAIAIGEGNDSKVEDTITMGHSNTASVGGGIAIGQDNVANSGGNAGNTMIAIGRENEATALDTVAIGRKTKATANTSVALGARSEATGAGSVAIGGNGDGYKTTSNGLGAVALGMQAKADGTAATAVGGVSEATANGAAAFGQGAKATAVQATALGYKSEASVKDGVALGSTSKATVDKGVKGFNPAEDRDNKYGGLAGTAQTSTLAAVSVGDGATATRQITGLAAGTNDTDAVNVAQLRSVNLKYAGDTGKGDVLLDNGTLKIKGDDPTFISTSADKNGVTVKAKIGADITTNADGKAVAPTTNGIATTDNVTQAINNSGWKVTSANNGGTTNGTTSEKVSPGDTVTFKAGKNIVLDQAGKQFTYSLNKDVDLTKDGSLTIGDTKVNNDGLTITGGPSVTKTGIDAGNKNITNVKAGVNDTDAVNVKQLKDAKTKLVDGKNTKVTGEGTQDDPYKVNVEGDLKGITSISNADNGPKMTIGGNSINITGGPLNMGGSKITNVAPGTDDTDAVNVKQLKSAKTEVKAGNGVTVAKTQDATDGHDIYTVSSTGATGNTDPSKVEAGKNTTVTGDGTAATPYKVNVEGDLTAISSITTGNGSGKISFAGDQVVKVDGDHAISLDGKGGYVTGLQNKDWDITNPTVVSGRAATEDQLKKVSDGFNNTIKLAGNTGNTDTQKFNKTGGLSFGVVGANNGQYIKTTASGTDVVADLSDDAKAKLNHTFEVAPGSSNVTVSKDTTDPNKTVYKVAVANTPAAGASSTESVVKKAAATGDTNIADVTVGNGKNSGDPDAQYEVNVSRNAVKDAAREAVTVNNGGTTTGGNYTADADNPITVNPVKDDANHNTTYEVKFDGDKAAKQIPLTYKANGTGDQKVKLDKGLNFTNGSNTTASVAADGVVKYDLNKNVDLTKDGSLTIGDTVVNKDGLTITGGPSITKTGIDAGSKKITNVAPGTDGTDAVNYDQLKAARTVVTSNDNSVTINKTTNGDQVTYDLHVNAAAGTASTWNLKSGAVSATEGTHSGDTAQNIADGKSVTMQAGKNLTVKQTNDGAGNTEVAYALDKDLKDLTSVTTDKVTTKEIGLQDAAGNTTTIKKDGDRITYTNDGGTTVNKVANLKDEKHITATTAGNEYTVDNNGNVTMTYTDGEGNLVTGETAVIKGIAKNDLSNINNDGKKVITGLGSKVEAGDNVTVTDTTDATTGQKTYTVNAKLAKIENGKNTTKTGTGTDADPYKINVEGDLTDINSITNGAGSGKLTFGPNETVTVGGTNPITLNAKTGNIGGLTNKTFDPNNIVSGQAATEDQLKSAHDSLKASELHIAPTAVKAGSTEAKGGVVNGTENVYKYDAGTKKVTLTYNDGNGKAVTDTKAVIDFSDLNIPAAGNNYSFKTNATGNLEDGSNATETEVASGKTVNFGAGKNLTVKQEIGKDGNQTYTYALNKDLTNLDKVVVNGKDGKDGKDGVTITAPVEGKDGKDGLDGKVGISGKDGKDAVSISGKDGVGQIGLTGPKGKDGASINITTDNGKQTLVNREVGADGKPGKTTQRIIYVPTDKDGNPLKDENGNTIKREVATMDDGLVFGGNTGEAHKAALGTQVNVKGADANTDWNKFDGGKNIMTQVNGDTITVGLAKDLNVDNVDVNNNVTAKGTISAPTIKAGDTTIKNGVVTNLTHHIDNPTTVVDDKVLNITDEKKKEAATVRDVLNSGWNLQANGKPVDAVTHGNNVNFASDKGTVTVKANSDGKTSVVNLDVNVDNDTITVNNKGQLVANGATNFNVATKDGGNKVAKKGGSSTTKITAGKTITYTAGKNIAIEQNGGDILVSTTNDVNHNSVTTNDLTVNKGGNIDMGGNQIHNVKAGTKDTDAVNVSQLKQSIGDVHKRINKVGKEARGGIAGANAAAGLPQVYIPGKSMVAASAGTFKGESAVAVGYSRSSDNGKVIFKLQGNANTQGDVGGSVGVGYQW